MIDIAEALNQSGESTPDREDVQSNYVFRARVIQVHVSACRIRTMYSKGQTYERYSYSKYRLGRLYARDDVK